MLSIHPPMTFRFTPCKIVFYLKVETPYQILKNLIFFIEQTLEKPI